MNENEDPFGMICRACMSKDQIFHSILESVDGNKLRIFEMLGTTTPQIFIQINAADKLPKIICNTCLNKLNITYNFQQMVITSEKRMRSLLYVEPNAGLQKMHSLEDPLVEKELFHVSNNSLKQGIISEDNYFEFSNFIKKEEVSEGSHDLTNFVSEWTHQSEEHEQNILKVDKPNKPQSTEIWSALPDEEYSEEIEKPDERNRRNAQHPCLECGKIFDRPYRVRRHMAVHSKERQFECKICKYRFSKEIQLTAHIISHSDNLESRKRRSPEGYKCQDCPRRFEKHESLSAHRQCHKKIEETDKMFQCDVCQERFEKLSLLTNHMQKHPDCPKYKCHICDKIFYVNALHIEHLNKHGIQKKHVCVYCNKAFLQNSTLKEHIRVHTGEKPYLCPQCGKAFQNGSNLRQHLLRHSNEKKYQCPECPSKFACQSDRIKHMSMHRNIKPHKCDICGSSFTRSYTLAKHKRIHSGERPHKCDQCSMTFVFIDHMRRHMRTHTGEKPYKCKFCDRAYAESGDLNKHMRTHVGEKTYMCNQCPEAFKYQAELREHQISHYKEKQINSEISM
ncbi:zinc finger protein 331-like [Teleopsis dalmanni]|uniref:zinc finger protein 331-like n=1 Tax=Teleopsis dalmanni TaxID=139649 RepID=UPI0018CEA776|nr:zinc finger protein 331-like [Teleopsis dalmanni]